MNRRAFLLLGFFLMLVVAGGLSVIWIRPPTAVRWVSFHTPSGLRVKALYAAPRGRKKAPGLVYNHGTLYKKTDLQRSAELGYDLKKMTAALADLGFVTVSPIRYGGNGSAYEAELMRGCVNYLKQDPVADSRRLMTIGFSRGTYASLVGAAELSDFRAMALLAPRMPENPAWHALIDKVRIPTLVLYGENDLKDVRDDSRDILAPASGQKSDFFKVYEIDEAQHRTFMAPRREWWRYLVEFIWGLKIL